MFWNDDDHEGKRLALNNPKNKYKNTNTYTCTF